MRSLEELKEYYSNATKEEVLEDIYEDLEVYGSIGIMQFERPYAKRYLEEKKKETPNLLYPDSEEVYKDYYHLKDEVERYKRILDALDKEELYYEELDYDWDDEPITRNYSFNLDQFINHIGEGGKPMSLEELESYLPNNEYEYYNDEMIFGDD